MGSRVETDRTKRHLIKGNMPCWCGSGKRYDQCHQSLVNQIREYEALGYEVPDLGLLKTPAEVEGIKRSSQVNIAVLDYVAEHIGPGISTQQIDDWVSEITRSHGAIPAPLGYFGFPKSVCTSIDEVVCHGIPSKDRILKEGEIVNVDVSTILDGYYSDSSRMFLIGEVSPEKERLVRVAKECMDIGIEAVVPWKRMGVMGFAVNQHAIKNGYSVVRNIGGHGVGLEFHEDPYVSYTSTPMEGMLMVPGMVFTIEPMVNMGRPGNKTDKKDGWTVTTRDGLPSAQWEVTLLVTETGHEVLTW